MENNTTTTTTTDFSSGTTERFNRNDIKGILTVLRDNIRHGRVTVGWANYGSLALRVEVARAFGILQDDFNTEFFSPSTLKRFAVLFNPRGDGEVRKNPTQDQTAWALQNFINRRRDPWASYKRATETTAPAPTYLSDAGL